NISSRFGAASVFKWVTPVTLPPGRLKLATRSSWTGLAANSTTNRNGRRRCPCRKRCRSRGRGYHGHLTMNQISRQCGQPFVFVPGEAIFDSDVLTLDKACVFQTLTERGEELWGVAGRPGVEDPDHRHRLGLPRARRSRPCRGRSAEQRDELASLHHSITSSATNRMSRLIVSPTSLAAFTLMTSSNLVGRSTGKSAGFAPLSILSTYVAVRRNRSSRFAP